MKRLVVALALFAITSGCSAGPQPIAESPLRLGMSHSPDLNGKQITVFALPAGGRPSGVFAITRGVDGNLWFTEFGRGSVGRITSSGTVTEFRDQTHGAGGAIISGPRGDLWYTTKTEQAIGRITTTGTIKHFRLPAGGCDFTGLTRGPDGNVWFSDLCTRSIGKITASGGVVEFPVPRCGNDNGLWGLTTGPDGDLWFTTTTTQLSQVCFGKVTTSGQVTLYTPTVTADLRTIVCGPDGDLYATDTAGSGLVRITPSGVETRFATLLTSPYGLGVGPDDQIWMTGMSGQVEEFDPATNVMSPVATMPSQRGAQPSGFTGITIGPDRDMWFTSGDSGEGVAQYVGLYEKR